jgi:hypothetical protein
MPQLPFRWCIILNMSEEHLDSPDSRLKPGAGYPGPCGHFL